MFFKLIYSCILFLLCTGVFGEVAETSAVNVEELSCTLTNSKCSWYSKGGSPGLLWTLSDSSIQQRIPAPDERDGFLMLETDSEESKWDMIWSPKFKVRSKFVNLSMSVYCTEEADIELQMVEYEEGAPSVGYPVANIGSMVKKNTWHSIINLRLDEEFDDFEDKEYQMFFQGRIRRGDIIAIRNVQLQEMEIPTTFNDTETSIPTERSDATEETLSIVTTTDYLSTAKVETCHEYRLKARPVEEISCSFQDSECCWYSEGGSPGISWKLSNSSAESAIPKPNAGDGFLTIRSDSEETKWDMIWSPKFFLTTDAVSFSLSVFCAEGSNIELQLVEYEEGKASLGFPLLDADDQVQKNSWQNITNFRLDEDFEDFEGKVFQLFLQGKVKRNEFIAIRNLLLKEVKEVTTSSSTVSSGFSDDGFSEGIGTSQKVSTEFSEDTGSGIDTTTSSATTTTESYADCEQYRSTSRNVDEMSCEFQKSSCCWYSKGGSPGALWKLSNNTADPQIPSEDNDSGFLMLRSDDEERQIDMIWSPKFTVPTESVTLTISVFATRRASVLLHLVKYEDENFQGYLVLDITERIQKNSWSEVINYELNEDFENYKGKVYQIFIQGDVSANEFIAIKNMVLKSNVVSVSTSDPVTDLVTTS